MSDEKPTPPLGELYYSVDGAGVNAHDRKNHSGKQGHDRACHRLQQTVAQSAADEIHRADEEDSNREELEDDTSNHDVRSSRGVAADLVGFAGGHAAADSLDDE